jgi:hypothetical protein
MKAKPNIIRQMRPMASYHDIKVLYLDNIQCPALRIAKRKSGNEVLTCSGAVVSFEKKRMAYSEKLAQRIRKALGPRRDIAEKKMFGGLAFLLGGKMCCGVLGDDLMVRVGPDKYDEALSRPHVRPMDFTGRPMKGFVYIGPEGCKSAAALSRWVNLGIGYASSI